MTKSHSKKRWTIRNYNAALREIKRINPSLTHKAAQQAYRTIRDRLKRSLTGAEIKRHPRIARQEAKKALQLTVKAPKPKPPIIIRPIPVTSLDDWVENYNIWSQEEEIEFEEWESTAEYRE